MHDFLILLVTEVLRDSMAATPDTIFLYRLEITVLPSHVARCRPAIQKRRCMLSSFSPSEMYVCFYLGMFHLITTIAISDLCPADTESTAFDNAPS